MSDQEIRVLVTYRYEILIRWMKEGDTFNRPTVLRYEKGRDIYDGDAFQRERKRNAYIVLGKKIFELRPRNAVFFLDLTSLCSPRRGNKRSNP